MSAAIPATRADSPSNASRATIRLPRPDDWHLHLRDGDALAAVVGATARQFARALVMPNLRPPITTVAMADDYRARILAALALAVPADDPAARFQPLMTLYLTDATSREQVLRAAESDRVLAFKLYPAGATTNSENGVTDLRHCDAALEAMQESGLVLCVHGEVTQSEVDVFDREARFIDEVLIPLRARYPALRIVFEHITTREAAQYVAQSGRVGAGAGSGRELLAATITPQHLLFNRNSLFQGGMRPHYYCLPVLKRERHREAVLAAAVSGSPRFFLGTDSAPHERSTKETSCGCAGCFSAPTALELYATAFELAGALDRLPDFASRFGADFYGLPVSNEMVSLVPTEQVVPASLPYAGGSIVPLQAGETLHWQFQDESAGTPPGG